ncbi:hypothetical protein AB0I55_29160 [Actinocatenispora sera]
MTDQQLQPATRPVRRADDYEAPGPGDVDQGVVPAESTQDGDR